MINQCDGCRRGLPMVNGNHKGPGMWDMIGCTKGRYPEPEAIGNTLVEFQLTPAAIERVVHTGILLATYLGQVVFGVGGEVRVYRQHQVQIISIKAKKVGWADRLYFFRATSLEQKAAFETLLKMEGTE